MKFICAAWCIVFIFIAIGSTPPSVLDIKNQAEKIIKLQQDLRKLCNDKIHEKESRKTFKAKLNELLRLANAAYLNAENNETYAKQSLERADKLATKAKHDSIIKSVVAAL